MDLQFEWHRNDGSQLYSHLQPHADEQGSCWAFDFCSNEAMRCANPPVRVVRAWAGGQPLRVACPRKSPLTRQSEASWGWQKLLPAMVMGKGGAASCL